MTNGLVSQAADWGINLYGALRCHWNNRKYGANKLKFPLVKEVFQKLSANLAPALKNVHQPSPRTKKFKECRF
jgi:hypothetical protein